jgi:hypothetical protein
VIDIKKKYKTRSGLEVVLASTEMPGDRSVIGVYYASFGEWCSCRWDIDGYILGEHEQLDLDLIEVKEPEETITLSVTEALQAFNVSGNANDFLNACGFTLPEKHSQKVLKCWVNFYTLDLTTHSFSSKETADRNADIWGGRIGQAIEVTLEVPND